jgi:hypothetical protein
VTLKAPYVKNPSTPSPMTRAAGTKTGLKITKSGVATASPISVPTRMRPARKRRVSPTGNKVKPGKLKHPFQGGICPLCLDHQVSAVAVVGESQPWRGGWDCTN